MLPSALALPFGEIRATLSAVLQALRDNLFYGALLSVCFGALVVGAHLVERFTSRRIAQRLGWRALLVTGCVGVTLHELSHLIAARLFGHRIIAWKLFEPDPVTATLGYVRHAYAKRSAWQLLGNFFIGIAPFVAGCTACYLLLRWLIPISPWRLWAHQAQRACGHILSRPTNAALSWTGVMHQLGPCSRNVGGLAGQLLQAVWTHRTAWLPLQLFLLLAVACHMAPSRSDLASTLPALGVAGVLLVLVALAATLFGLSLAGALPLLIPAALGFATAALFQGVYLLLVRLTVR